MSDMYPGWANTRAKQSTIDAYRAKEIGAIELSRRALELDDSNQLHAEIFGDGSADNRPLHASLNATPAWASKKGADVYWHRWLRGEIESDDLLDILREKGWIPADWPASVA